ncbi:MAG: hypothetical protein CM15mP79_1650 [Methanobacteriota archaeon]|nr:MAG: hypothetical protein CM15mP79_1650 [Euryarchaeota archaeon]
MTLLSWRVVRVEVSVDADAGADSSMRAFTDLGKNADRGPLVPVIW